jgi:hypothetical protein
MIWSSLLLIVLGLAVNPDGPSSGDFTDLPRLTPGKVAAQNALWIEDDPSNRFEQNKHVVLAEIEGPAEITMLHFAVPGGRTITRDVILKITWDGEKDASVECPLVDFFCDPAGMRNDVNTIFVNKRQGYNAYFPMPFRRSAKIELIYDGPLSPGEPLVLQTPAYFYVMYRKVDSIPEDTGYFHAYWRQESVVLGKQEYVALDAKGNGKFVGWNVTVRRPGEADYPVDENEKFFVDGETKASVEFEGLEDSFGFSWGFPESPSFFPRTGYFPFFEGAAAYRFFLQDAVSFEKSLRVAIGFGPKDLPAYHETFSKPRNMLQFSSTVYWYQHEPHAAWPPLPPAAQRAPAPEGKPLYISEEKLPAPEDLKRRGVKLEMFCGRPGNEVVFAEPGFAAQVKEGFAYAGWDPPVYHCRASEKAVQIEFAVPARTAGNLRLFMIDPDRFRGGRKQIVRAAGKTLGNVEDFAQGRWLEYKVSAEQTESGKLLIEVANNLEGANAVISIVEWIGDQ